MGYKICHSLGYLHYTVPSVCISYTIYLKRHRFNVFELFQMKYVYDLLYMAVNIFVFFSCMTQVLV